MAETKLSAQSFDILRRYAGGALAEDITLALGIKKPAVLEVLDVWCSRDRVRARQVVAEDEARRGVTAPPPPKQPAPGELVLTPTGNGGRPAPRDLEELLAAALKTGVPKIVALAEKVGGLVDDLAQLVDEHEVKAAARARVAELEAQLAEAREQAGMSAPTRKHTAEPDSAAIRAWAQERGMEVKPNGRIPQVVLNAYERRPR